MKTIFVRREELYDMYVNQKLSSLKIGQKLGVPHRTIRKKLKKFNIPRRTLSEALVKKKRVSFSGNLAEKAYLLGLRTGDFWARKKNHSIRVQTTTTHPAQIELLRNSLGKYGDVCQYYSKHKMRQDEWFIYVDLDCSFDFLVEKPTVIPSWILENENFFYSFLMAYSDCEGCFKVIKSHNNSVRFVFSLKTGDKIILEQIKKRIEQDGYFVTFYLDQEKGKKGNYGFSNFNIYNLTIYRKENIFCFIQQILPLSKHPEKIIKMNFILQNKEKSWAQLSPSWNNLRNKIKKEVLKVF